MSYDYATLVSAIILASLAAGTAQTYTLTRGWFAFYVDAAQELVQARDRSLDALRQGDAPPADDIELLTNVFVKPHRYIIRWLRGLLAWTVWVTICALLVTIQIAILRWAAVSKPDPNPHLAKVSFFAAASVVALLVAEAIIRGFARAVTDALSFWKQLKNIASDAHDEALFEVVRARVAPEPAPASDPAAAPDS
ncbi:hypothetical protein ACN2WE_00140 [Streptomyces sp. cg28]|uniref:hypothetical protein n=1 Tax=Streptomyces sp. cg28 TaxID=3403457 RepID=UPI003B21A85D